jgi:hypothetical protein
VLMHNGKVIAYILRQLKSYEQNYPTHDWKCKIYKNHRSFKYFFVDDIFESVTWHHQRRPFIRVLTCKTGKTRRRVAGGASSDDQVSPVFVRRGERERSQRIMNCPLIILYSLFIPLCAIYMSLLPLSSIGLHVDVSYLP